MPRIDNLWYDLELRSKQFDDGVLQSQAHLASFVRYAAGQPIAVIGALGVAATVAGVKIAEMGARFEKEMAAVQTNVQGTKAQLNDLGRGVLQVFRDLPVGSIHELTKGLYDITSTGIPAAQAIDYLRTAAQAAVGGVTDVATAVDGLTSITNAYGQEGITATEAADKMFKAVQIGKLTYGELAQSIGRVVDISGALGIRLEDTLAAIDQLTLSGVKADEAVTAVRQAMINIQKPTAQFTEQFPKLAAEFTAGRLQGEGLIQFLKDFQKASNNSQVALSSLFTNVRGYLAAISILKDNGERATRFMNEIAESTGAAAKAASYLEETTSAANQRLKNELTATLTELGTDLLPTVNRGLNATVSILKALEETLSHSTGAHMAQSLKDLSNVRNTFDPQQLQNYRQQIQYILREINAGHIDLSKFSRDQLSTLEDAAAFFNANGKVTVEQFRTSQQLLNQFDPGRRTNEYIDAYNRISAALQQSNLAAARTADQQKKADADARTATLQRIIATRDLAEQEARELKTATGDGAAVATAQQTKAAALKAIAEAQEKLTQAVKDGQAAAAKGDTAGVQEAERQANAARTTIESQREALSSANDALSKQRAKAAAAAKQLAHEQQSLAQQITSAMVATTTTAVDDLQAQFDDLAQKVKEKFGTAIPADVQRGLDVMQEHIANVKLMEPIQKQFADFQYLVQQAAAQSPTGRLDPNATGTKVLLASLQDQIDKTTELVQKTKEGTADHAAMVGLLRQELALRQQILGTGKVQAKTDATATQQMLDHVRAVAQTIQSAASGALQLAQAFGIVNDTTATTLQRLVDIGANIKPLVETLKTYKAGTTDENGKPLATIGSVVSAALPVIGGLAGLFSGLFGQDAQLERARREAVEQNTLALERNTKELGDLAHSTESGSAISAAQQVAQGILANPQELPGLLMNHGFNATATFTELFKNAGISKDQLDSLAQTLGINLDNAGLQQWIQFVQALASADTSSVAGKFADQLQHLKDTFTAFNTTKPLDQLEQTVEFLKGKDGIPAIADALQGIDLTTTGGRAQALKALQGLFTALANGSVSATSLGAATIQEANQEILDLIQQITGLDAAGGTSGTGGFSVSRTITEVTGDVLRGLLTTDVAWNKMTAQNTALMAQALTGASASLPTVAPPIVPTTTSGPGGVTVTIQGGITVQVTVPAGTSPSDAAAFGAAAGSAAAQEFNRTLGDLYRQANRTRGQVTV